MKALTICQPYAELIRLGEKTVENRTWPTPYRGWLAIHAGKSRAWLQPEDHDLFPHLDFGAVVAIGRLAACAPVHEVEDPWARDVHASGPWCWCLASVHALPQAVPCRGAQGLWDLDQATQAAISEQVTWRP